MAYSWETADIFDYELLKQFARENRSNMTEAESRLWEFLKKNQLGSSFRRQHIIGTFIADFICLSSKLIIEVDGRYHTLPNQMINDEERTKYLEESGYKVLRFTNEEVLCDIDKVLNIIKKNI